MMQKFNFSVILSTLIITSCSASEAPKCANEDVIKLVLDSKLDDMEQTFSLMGGSFSKHAQMELHSPVHNGYDTDAKMRSCSIQSKISPKNGKKEGDNHFLEIVILSGGTEKMLNYRVQMVDGSNSKYIVRME